MKILVAVKDINRAQIYKRIFEEHELGLGRLGLTGLAALTALVGLIANSAAIFIPALFFSALAGPMTALSLGLALQDWKMAREAAQSFLMGVMVIFLVAVTAAWLSPLHEATQEILARKEPNLIGLMVALVAGIATVWIRCTGTERADLLPQALISAVTLLPLCVAGYGVGTAQWQLAAGAGKLFLVNSLGVILAAELGFLLSGLRARRAGAERILLSRVQIVIGAAVLVVLAAPLLGTLRSVVLQQHTRAEIQKILDPLLRRGGASLAELDFREAGFGMEISPVIRTPEYLGQDELNGIKQQLQVRTGKPIRLNMKQVLQLETGDVVTGGVVRREGPDYKKNIARALKDLHGASRAAVISALTTLPAARAEKIELTIPNPNQPLRIDLQLNAPDRLSEDALGMLTEMISRNLDLPVQLNVRTRLTGSGFHGTVPLPSTAALNWKTKKCLNRLGEMIQKDQKLKAELVLSAEETAGLVKTSRALQTYLASRYRFELNQLAVRVVPVASVPIASTDVASLEAESGQPGSPTPSTPQILWQVWDRT